MTFEKKVRIAPLPEMRLAYFETSVASADLPAEGPVPAFSDLWEEFNAWRLRTRPALGRVDIAALAWSIPGETSTAYRTCVPVRSDAPVEAPARTTFFPGGLFAYCYADDLDEVAEALATAAAGIDPGRFRVTAGPIEVFKFHFNLDQHPCDAGYLLERLQGNIV